MFKFLKEKLKEAVSKISEEIEEEGEEESKVELVEKEEVSEEVKEEKPVEEVKEEVSEEKEKPKGFFAKIKDKFSKEEKLEDVPVEEMEEIPVEEIEEKGRIEKEEEQKKEEEKKDIEEAKKIVEEKLEKKELPSMHELATANKEELKKLEEQKLEEKKEELKEKVEEIKEEIEDKKEEVAEEKVEEVKEEVKEKPVEEPKGLFGKIRQKIVTKKINEKQFDDLFWELEVVLLENNVAVEVIEKVKDNLKIKLVDNPIPRSRIEKTISDSLRQTLEGLFNVEKLDLLQKAEEKKPLVICFVGINGSGKTTTIAKFTKYFQNNGKSVVLAAADTFRAAAIDQLQVHADKLKVKLIKHDYGADPAAVAFDAVKHAEAKGIDVVLIDTAGRMHSNSNLMDEMDKIIRVAKPHLKIFVGESITGNDCTEQAKKFNETIGLDGIVLSKADIDEKGGAAISISYVTGKPIVFLGVGQEYDDLQEFDSNVVLESLEL